CVRLVLCIVFFFQAEDGIRDRNVTGVQTCALPILAVGFGGWLVINGEMSVGNLVTFTGLIWMINVPMRNLGGHMNDLQKLFAGKIGRASCRGRENNLRDW